MFGYTPASASASASASTSQKKLPARAVRDEALLEADPIEPVQGDAAAVQQQREDNAHLIGKGKERQRHATTPAKGWPHFVAGGIGGMCGAILTSPLDVVKTRLQSDMYTTKIQQQNLAKAARPRGIVASSGRLAYHFVETAHLLKEITQKEGARALFRGLGPTLVGVVPARSINFYTYGNGKLLLAEHFNGGRETAPIHLSAAAIAGIVTATATNPIWVVKTRLQLEHHAAEKAAKAARTEAINVQKGLSTSKGAATALPSSRAAFSTSAGAAWPSQNAFTAQPGFFKAGPSPSRPSTNSLNMALTILKTEGMAGFYRGITASYLGVAEGTMQWTLYEQFKKLSRAREGDSDTVQRVRSLAGTVGAAGSAKMIASLISYPHEVLRTRLRQAPPEGRAPKYTGLLQSIRLILREEGAGALYGGLSAHLLRVVPNAAIMFVVYESVLGFSKRAT